MGGQGIDRREALRYLALASVAGRYTGFSKWVFGGSSNPSSTTLASEQNPPYEPRFFTVDEYRVVDILTDLIIPEDGTPGARDAGVAEFVDFMAASDPGIQVPFRDGLRWLEAHSLRLHGRSFPDLAKEDQNEILRHLAYLEWFRPREEEGRAFFGLIRRYTAMGFYTSRIGMEELDSPFLQTVYAEPPECPHVDDREHRNLQPQPEAGGIER
jgi:gluconate 2-dehydrogenase gamma chain